MFPEYNIAKKNYAIIDLIMLEKQKNSMVQNIKSILKKEEPPILLFSQMEGKCYHCGKCGHKSPLYAIKTKPNKEWPIMWFHQKITFMIKQLRQMEKTKRQ